MFSTVKMFIHIIVKIVLWIIGFTAIGIRAGSLAAWWMAKMGIVTVNSFFALLQSFAMKK